jgi:hypothetical protein
MLDRSTLSPAESDFLRHIMMFGSDGYPVQKVGRSWHWVDFWGVKGAPCVYKSKREATAAVERYIEILIDKKAGRLGDAPAGPQEMAS